MGPAATPARWSGVLALCLVASGCSGAAVSLTLPPVTTTTETVSPTSADTTFAPPTTPPTTVATTTSRPLEPWQVPGRRYYFPVQPPEAATYSDAHHDYPAADIFAPAGTTVVAVTDGVVDELRRLDPWDAAADDPATRGGRFVSIVGDDGVRYYCSHLESVARGLRAGDRVVAGQAVGTLGNSGDAVTTPPHCHFGISRPLGPGDWEVRRGEVWPYRYLQAWGRGEDVTPDLPEG
jgi:murein DD-endopeptidase MepM/ murein hydrolase activator NlpD